MYVLEPYLSPSQPEPLTPGSTKSLLKIPSERGMAVQLLLALFPGLHPAFGETGYEASLLLKFASTHIRLHEDTFSQCGLDQVDFYSYFTIHTHKHTHSLLSPLPTCAHMGYTPNEAGGNPQLCPSKEQEPFVRTAPQKHHTQVSSAVSFWCSHFTTHSQSILISFPIPVSSGHMLISLYPQGRIIPD